MVMNKGGTSRVISLHVPGDILRRDPEIFRQRALDLRASMARIIPADDARGNDPQRSI